MPFTPPPTDAPRIRQRPQSKICWSPRPLDLPEAPPLDLLDAPPLDLPEAPPLDLLDAPPLDLPEAPPLDLLEAPPVDPLEASPLHLIEAVLLDELDALDMRDPKPPAGKNIMSVTTNA